MQTWGWIMTYSWNEVKEKIMILFYIIWNEKKS